MCLICLLAALTRVLNACTYTCKYQRKKWQNTFYSTLQKTTAVCIGLEPLSPESPSSILLCSAPKNRELKVKENKRLALFVVMILDVNK